jgi:glycosyltransferase involved in cell wall biosynthesis
MGISVVVPVYNGERYLAEALGSVQAQALQPDEIVVIDDGSTDGSVSIAAGFPRVRVISQPNAGCAVARNRGVAASTQDVIAFLDADDVWLPDRLARAHALLAADPELAFVVCAQQNFLSPELATRPGWVAPAMLEFPQHGFATNSLMVRRQPLARVGLFDPAHVPMEDSEWLVRALDAGLKYVHIDQPLVRRRIHASNLTGTMRGTPAHGAAIARILHASLLRRRAAGNGA